MREQMQAMSIEAAAAPQKKDRTRSNLCFLLRSGGCYEQRAGHCGWEIDPGSQGMNFRELLEAAKRHGLAIALSRLRRRRKALVTFSAINQFRNWRE
jgi:hypothetical protein